MREFHYHEPIKSRIKVFCKKWRFILQNKIFKLKNRKNKEKVERANFNIENLKKYNQKPDYQTLFKDTPSPNVAVYTCLFGDYDTIKKIKCKSPLCDYWIITDQEVDPKSGWKLLNVEFPEELRDAPPNVKNRYCKMHPHLLFPQYDFSIYFDASIQIDADIFPLVGRLGDKFLGMYDHGYRNCIYDEAETVIRVKKAPEDIVRSQIQKYREEGFPEHYGLTEGIAIVRTHNDPLCIKIMEEWWDIFMEYSKRDQLGLMYVLWKNGLTYEDIAKLGFDYQHEPRLSSQGHNNGR